MVSLGFGCIFKIFFVVTVFSAGEPCKMRVFNNIVLFPPISPPVF